MKENLTELGPRKILRIETTLKNIAVGFCGREGLKYFFKIMLTSLTRSEAVFYPQKIY